MDEFNAFIDGIDGFFEWAASVVEGIDVFVDDVAYCFESVMP